jgi:signal transduction histidine kinase
MIGSPVFRETLSRIPGRGAVSVVTWLAPLLPATGAILYVTESSPSWATIVTVAPLVAVALMGPLWWLTRTPLQRLPRSATGGLICLATYAAIGLFGGLVMIAVLHLGAPGDPAPQMLTPATLAITSVIMTVLLSTLVAVAASWYWDLQAALSASRSRRQRIGELLRQREEAEAAERNRIARLITDDVINPLTAAERLLAEQPARVGDDLEALAGSVIRPLSHRFYSDEFSQVRPLALAPQNYSADSTAQASVRSTLSRPLAAGIPVILLTIVSVPGSLLIAITDPSAGWWVPPVNLMSIAITLFLLSYVPLLCAPRILPGWRQWLLLTALYSIVGIVAGVVLAWITQQAAIGLVVTGVSFHVFTGLLLSAGRTWWMALQEERRRFDAESLSLRRQDLEELKEARRIRERAAMILHSQVQTRLLAIASLLANDPEDLDEALDSLRQIRDEVLVPLRDDVTSASLTSDDAITATSLQQDFPGTAIELSIHPHDAALASHPKASVARDLIIEGIANAIRHGNATSVTISIVIEHEIITLSVIDDGSGLATDRQIQPGLGLCALRDASRRWQLTPASTGGTRLEAILTPA